MLVLCGAFMISITIQILSPASLEKFLVKSLIFATLSIIGVLIGETLFDS